MTRTETLVQTLNDAWTHKYESLEPLLETLTEEMASYQHAAYADVPLEEPWPAQGSITWHLAHMAYWSEYYLGQLRQWGTPLHVTPPHFESHALPYLLDRLRTAHNAVVSHVQSLTDDQLDTLTGTTSLQTYILMCARHDTWHASQIAVAKRLYKAGVGG
jgi:hypothetical protein